jgi:XTP/dITP diphosphohydrolase
MRYLKKMNNNIIVLASRNRKKIGEIEKIFGENNFGMKILTLDDIGYDGDIIESGSHFEENALIKASVPAKLGYIGIADDSGLAVDALHGAPGVYSARYAGENATDQANNAKLLRELEGVPAEKRQAKFVCVIACVIPQSETFVVRGECEGVILDEQRGNNGFGYDPLFYYPEFDKTFAELTNDEKNKISHRGKALKIFRDKFFNVM